MKENMMIVKCNIVSSDEKNPDNSIFELELLPRTMVRKVTSMQEIISGGSMEEMISSALQYQQGQLRNRIYITLGEWKNSGYRIGSHVTVELLPEKK